MINIIIEGYNVDKEKKYIQHSLMRKLFDKKIRTNSLSSKNFKNSKNYQIITKQIKDLDVSEENKLMILDYLKYRYSCLSSINKVNILNKCYISVFNDCNLLFDEKSQFLIENIKEEEKIDLLVFLDSKSKTKKHKKTKHLREYIRLNNHEFCLFAFNSLKKMDKIVDKIYSRILEFLEDEEKNEEDKWEELYRIDIEEFDTPDDYISYKLKYKKKFVNKVLKYSNGGTVLEAGCGTGLMAGYLQKLGCTVTAGDISQKILDLAKEIAATSKVIEPCYKYEKVDILNLKYKSRKFSTSISNGALEHFSNSDIIEILKQQMIAADYVIFGIPSTYFGMTEKMFGNERSLKLKEWKHLINEAGGEILESTGFHYYKFFQRVFEVKKWFKPKAFWLFVIRKKETRRKNMKEIIYVTGNESKIFSAREILSPLGFNVNNKKIPLTEIQADDVEDVAKHKAKEASEILKNNVLINDTGLFVEALGGFPGPYTHYADDKLGENGLLKLLEGEANRNAYFKEAFAYCEFGKDPVVITSLTKGIIATEKSGEYGFSWDFIFIPDGKDKTMGCYPDEERCLVWNTDGYSKLAEYLKEKED